MSTEDLRTELATTLPERPFSLAFWDGSELPSTTGDGPRFMLRSPVALGHLIRAPGQLGLGRAYVSGALDVDEVGAALQLLDDFDLPPVPNPAKARLLAATVKAGALKELPRVPAVELRPQGRLHSILRDRRAVTHHYDVGNEFFALFLDESMTYSCGIWSRGATTLEEAQFAKRDLVCTKLELRAGERVLDVGCGWGAFAIHAAQNYGVHVTGITLSEPQAEEARRRVAAAELTDQIDIRVLDYRALTGERYDAIASIGMVEHVGEAQIDEYARTLAGLLDPGGRLLNHGIARLRHTDPKTGPFSERYVFPDAAPLQLSRIQLALERGGFETRHVEGFRLDYARTLEDWLERLEARADEGVRLAGAERMRVWGIYLRAARRGFESGFMSVYQVLASRT